MMSTVATVFGWISVALMVLIITLVPVVKWTRSVVSQTEQTAAGCGRVVGMAVNVFLLITLLLLLLT